MENNDKKNSLIVIIILAVVFGMAAGVVGDLIARVYLLDNSFNIPFYGEINFSNGQYNGQNLIIRDAKKVVVEQNDKVVETAQAVQSSIVGIFKKIDDENTILGKTDKSIKFNIDNYYVLDEPAAQGLILTSDGWIISSFKPENLNYVVIASDGTIYEIDKIVSDAITAFHFLHVTVRDFPVRKFVESSGLKNGQLVLSINWSREVLLDSIINNKDAGSVYLFSTDSFSDEISLRDGIEDKFSGTFFFNLSGDIIGLSDNKGKVRPINHFTGAINSLLKNKLIIRPSLGINYIDLSKLTNKDFITGDVELINPGALIYKNQKGVSVEKGSPAEIAGLKEGDIIVSVDGVRINKENNLTDIILSYPAANMVKIAFIRNNKEMEVDVALGGVE